MSCDILQVTVAVYTLRVARPTFSAYLSSANAVLKVPRWQARSRLSRQPSCHGTVILQETAEKINNSLIIVYALQGMFQGVMGLVVKPQGADVYTVVSS